MELPTLLDSQPSVVGTSLKGDPLGFDINLPNDTCIVDYIAGSGINGTATIGVLVPETSLKGRLPKRGTGELI